MAQVQAVKRTKPGKGSLTGGTVLRWIGGAVAVGFASLCYAWLTLPDVRPLVASNPSSTAFMDLRADEAHDAGKPARHEQRWVSYSRISPHLKRAVLDAMLADEFAFVVPTTHEGETLARFAIVNPQTSEGDIRGILDAMQ